MPKMTKGYWMEVLAQAEFTLLPWQRAFTAEELEGRRWKVTILFPGDSLPELRTQSHTIAAFDKKHAILAAIKYLPREVKKAFKARSKARNRLYTKAYKEEE